MPDKTIDHATTLQTLARCDAAALKAFAEDLLETIGHVEVVQNRTGLVMLPMRDTVKGTAFHLGEVLVSEARVKLADKDGYGMRTGRDLEAAMAMAIVDALWQAGRASNQIGGFLTEQAGHLAAADETRLRDVEATRVNMETF